MSDSHIVVRRPARCVSALALSWLTLAAGPAAAQPVSLGSAESFAVLGQTTVSNTGVSSVTGDLGVSLTGAVSGFPPGTVAGGAIHQGDAVAVQALLDAEAAFEALEARRCREANDLTGENLGGKMLAPGTYCFDGNAPLTGTLTLTGAGPWIFQIGGMLTIDANAQVVAPGITSACKGSQVHWQVGGASATVGAAASVIGNILSKTDVMLGAGASLDGRAVAIDGDVTMTTSQVAVCSFGGTFPPHAPIEVTGGGQLAVPDPDSSSHRRGGHGRATFAFVAIPGAAGAPATGRFIYLNRSNRSFGRMHIFGDVEDIDVVALDRDGSPKTVRFTGTCNDRPDCTFSVLAEDNARRHDDEDDDDDDDDDVDDDDDGDDDDDDGDEDDDRRTVARGDDRSGRRDRLGVVIVSNGRIVEARALRRIARGNIQFHEPPEPALTTAINDVEFTPGNVMTVTASLDPGPTPALADAYVVVQLPDGQFLSWTGAGLVPGLVPIARGFVPFAFEGVVARVVIPRGAPAGRYTWLSALTAAGTLNLLTPIATSVFTITP